MADKIFNSLKPGQKIKGIIPGQMVEVVDVKRRGTAAVELFYKRSDGKPGTQLLYEDDESKIEIVNDEKRWTFDANGELFRLAAEAYRIHLAHLFDPVLAVHTSLIEPLPHQITAVYKEMLPRHPLRFLLADDPGAGKTIMAGLLIKELMIRGDVERCLICVPGKLTGQWQDELWFKFQTRFEIINRESFENVASGNPFLEKDLVIIRLDQIARDEGLKGKLRSSDWDLIIVDEAHKMSAHFWGNELEETKRYKLGMLLSEITRHFLLMTATPHNGKEEDFQLFLKLLDHDRFEGRFREGVHRVDIDDLMRRMVKEELVRFNGKPLFPERKAYTVNYPLSPEEKELYDLVSEYVREEFNRAERIKDGNRRGTVGFALTVLQRRLASSPAAIYESLKRRKQKLKKRLMEVKRRKSYIDQLEPSESVYDPDYLDDLDDAPADEVEDIEEEIADSATAALTIEELEAEINTLEDLEILSHRVLQKGVDNKWEQLASILQDDERMITPQGKRRKLVIFTEHLDTLDYLWNRIATLFGSENIMVKIHGGVPRKKRRELEDRFRNDPDVYFLVATDAAAEGINLQAAHLMVNYDLPWNPNRLEQRFGRIHRIGQTEVCHLWNLVAGETREGHVYQRLLSKLETESKALNGKVFDVLGVLFDREPLRKLLIEAIRYGNSPEVREKLEKKVEHAVDKEHVRELLNARSLATETMDTSKLLDIKEEMERYTARRLQPHYIKSFFIKAFEHLGGNIHEREPGRFRISYVPARIRNHAKTISTHLPVWEKYDRVCFDKSLVSQPGITDADFICPGHPLLDTVIDLTMNKYRVLLDTGSILIDKADPGDKTRALFFIEQNIQDAGDLEAGDKHVISKEVHFVEINEDGEIRSGGAAPYLDYEPADKRQKTVAQRNIEDDWISTDIIESEVLDYAIANLVPKHLKRVESRRDKYIEKTLTEVHKRLTKEINYWDRRASELRKQEKEGKSRAKLNAQLAQQRADSLASRLEKRTRELKLKKQISAAPPVTVGGSLVIPIGFFEEEKSTADANKRKVIEEIAMQAVIEIETELGHYPEDVSSENVGYDIESFDPETERLRFIEVKGRQANATTVTISRNEILTGINSPENYILAIILIEDSKPKNKYYVKEPFHLEPDFAVTSSNYKISDLLEKSGEVKKFNIDLY